MDSVHPDRGRGHLGFPPKSEREREREERERERSGALLGRPGPKVRDFDSAKKDAAGLKMIEKGMKKKKKRRGEGRTDDKYRDQGQEGVRRICETRDPTKAL